MIYHSSIEPIYYLLPIIGFVIGLFGTMLGGGGGFFFLPILTLVLKVPAQTAVITSLVATLPICVVGSIGHYNKRNINFRVASMFAVAGMGGAFLGAYTTRQISADGLKTGFGIYSILISMNMAFNTLQKRRAELKGKGIQRESYPGKVAKSSIFGFFAGTITGVFGVSATAPILAGLFSLRMPLKMVIGTSLLVVLTNTLFSVGAHFLIGTIDLTLVYFLTAGSAAGALLGPRWLTQTNTDHAENRIRYAYAAVMAILGMVMVIG